MIELDHPNVLNLVGVCINPEDNTLNMVMPFMHYGDVRSFLKKQRGDVIELDDFPKVHYVIYVIPEDIQIVFHKQFVISVTS